MRIADKSIEEVEELVKTALESGINFLIMQIFMVEEIRRIIGEVLKDILNIENR